jgi:hypothetical protein
MACKSLKINMARNLGFHGILYLYGLNSIMIKKTGWFLFFLLMAAACLDEPECFSLNNNLVGVIFKKLSDKKADTVFFATIKADGTTTLFAEDSAMTGYETLSLNYFQDSTVYHFQGANRAYTLPLHYSARPQFVSEDCGERFVLAGLRARKNPAGFDSVRVVNNTPKKRFSSGTNIEIYRCPDLTWVKLWFSESLEITTLTASHFGLVNFTAGEKIKTLRLPLDTDATTATFDFTFASGDPKKLVVNYENTKKQLYRTCGEQYVLSNVETDMTATTFTEAKTIHKAIQDPPLRNIEITF